MNCLHTKEQIYSIVNLLRNNVLFEKKVKRELNINSKSYIPSLEEQEV